MSITKINLNLNSLVCTSSSVGPGGDNLQIQTKLWDTTTPAGVILQPRQTFDCGSLNAGASIGSKVLWSYAIPGTWGTTAAWPDKMQLRMWINKIESFLQSVPTPPAPPAPLAPASSNIVFTSPCGGPITLNPVGLITSIGNALKSVPANLLHLILESTLANYNDNVDGAGIQKMQASGGDIFTHAFVDSAAGKAKTFGAWGSSFTVDYPLVAA